MPIRSSSGVCLEGWLFSSRLVEIVLPIISPSPFLSFFLSSPSYFFPCIFALLPSLLSPIIIAVLSLIQISGVQLVISWNTLFWRRPSEWWPIDKRVHILYFRNSTGSCRGNQGIVSIATRLRSQCPLQIRNILCWQAIFTIWDHVIKYKRFEVFIFCSIQAKESQDDAPRPVQKQMWVHCPI